MFEDLEESKPISIRDIFDKIKYYLTDLLRRWYLILVLGLIGAGYLWYYAASSPPYYEADLSFIVKNATNSSGGIESVLSQMGYAGAQGNTNLDKIKTILFSKSVLTEVLYDSVSLNGKKDLLANHIAVIYGYDEDGTNKFKIESKYSDSSVAQNIAFNKVLGIVRGGDKKGNVITVTEVANIDLLNMNVRCIDEELSYALSMKVYEKLNDFYVNDKTANTQTAIRSLKREADSVGRLLKQKEYQLANARDRNYGIILSKNQVNQEEVQRDIMVLTSVYSQMRQNLEMSQFGLKNSGSNFDLLEHPVLPLDRKIKHPEVYALIGLGIGIMIIFLVIRRFLLDELKK